MATTTTGGAHAPRLSETQTTTLEAYADTIVPGAKRTPDDLAVAGVSDGIGAVEAGALTVLGHPAAGIGDGVGDMADLLNGHAAAYAAEHDLPTSTGLEFASLEHGHRRTLITRLTGSEEPMHDLWFLLALFSYMAYDSAPHRPTAEVVGTPSGLHDMGFAAPGPTGRWGFSPAGYGRPLAAPHPLTDERGNLP